MRAVNVNVGLSVLLALFVFAVLDLNVNDTRYRIANGLISADQIEQQAQWQTRPKKSGQPNGEEILYQGIVIARCATVSDRADLTAQKIITVGESNFPAYEGNATKWCERRLEQHPQMGPWTHS